MKLGTIYKHYIEIEKIVINHVKNHDSGVNRENDSIQEASNQGIREFGIVEI